MPPHGGPWLILALLPGYRRGVAAGAALGNKGQLHEWSDVDHPTDRPCTRPCNNNLLQIPIVRLPETVTKTKFALINARSLRNKTLLVHDYIDDCSADIVALTETWLRDEDNVSVSELCRDTFSFAHQPRGGARRGGGVGVLFRKAFHAARVTC